MPEKLYRFLRRTGLSRGVFAAWVILFASCATGTRTTSSKSTLWKIQSATNTVYLMGSIHILPKSVYPLKPTLRQAFDDSQRIIFEVALDDRDKSMAESFRAGLYPKGQTLSQHLSPKTLSLLRGFLPLLGLRLEKVERFRPWMVADLLTSLYLQRSGFESKRGLDLYFFALAQEKGKLTAGLETVKAQTQPFEKLTDAEADQYLRETILSIPLVKPWFKQMVRAWQDGDIQRLDAMINRSAKSDKFHQSMFDDRNTAWMPAIRGFVGMRTNVLVIAGSGHFVGSNGIIEQLRREGYLVTQL